MKLLFAILILSVIFFSLNNCSSNNPTTPGRIDTVFVYDTLNIYDTIYSTPPQPGIPSLSASIEYATGQNLVHLSWDSVSGAIGYRLYWSNNKDSVNTFLNERIQQFLGFFYIRYIPADSFKTYWYCITAINRNGIETAKSTPVALYWTKDY